MADAGGSDDGHIPSFYTAVQEKPAVSDAVAVAKQQVMIATANMPLLKVRLRRVIFCVHEINLQMYGFILARGNKLWQCFSAVLKWNTMWHEDTAQQNH